MRGLLAASICCVTLLAAQIALGQDSQTTWKSQKTGVSFSVAGTDWKISPAEEAARKGADAIFVPGDLSRYRACSIRTTPVPTPCSDQACINSGMTRYDFSSKGPTGTVKHYEVDGVLVPELIEERADGVFFHSLFFVVMNETTRLTTAVDVACISLEFQPLSAKQKAEIATILSSLKIDR